ncbi:alpha-L-fucosidase [Boeremia exigua]|uniref:alpha-L-fucosidase n=1 Tax=Boeremia exigua TaxID=749465 RepID=UPI001E8DADA8|nr:alpha-L-fucosidase [Boeremia exigua]KAH6638744.1 alpha-L-fucosidase [Boeremia exigua]
MRSSLSSTALLAASLFSRFIFAQATGPYDPTWASTDAHNASPEWFRDAKFGVYWHWGAFTTPQFASEWYGRYVYESDSASRREHTRRYGAPEVWGYDNFVTGANDLNGSFVQFHPVLSSKGGVWDPEDWIAAINASGARFAGPVAEHHDGYSMWDSKVNEWNSVSYGPGIDLVKLWERFIKPTGMKFMIAMHQAFNTNGFYEYAPQQTNSSLQKFYGQLGKEKSDELWLAKQLEILDHVQPDMIWNDYALDAPGWCGGFPCNIGEQQRLAFLAHYFNRGVEWGKEVLTTYKHFDSGLRDTSAVSDFERGGPADIVRPYWLTDDAISASSWSYTVGIRYYNSKQMIHSLLDRISKNGNMLLNISPTAAGILPDEQRKVLSDIGLYLTRFGESVYETRAWDIYGEGPNTSGGGSFTAPLTGNSSDIRFTRNKAKDVLYASILGWPNNTSVSIKSLASGAGVDLSNLASIELLGDASGQYVEVADWNQDDSALTIRLPSKPSKSHAYVLKLSFTNTIPVPLIAGGASFFTSGNASGPGISLPQGQFLPAFFEDAGTDTKDVQLLRVSSGAAVTVYVNGDLSGSSVVYTAGEHKLEVGALGSVKVAAA